MVCVSENLPDSGIWKLMSRSEPCLSQSQNFSEIEYNYTILDHIFFLFFYIHPVYLCISRFSHYRFGNQRLKIANKNYIEIIKS